MCVITKRPLPLYFGPGRERPGGSGQGIRPDGSRNGAGGGGGDDDGSERDANNEPAAAADAAAGALFCTALAEKVRRAGGTAPRAAVPAREQSTVRPDRCARDAGRRRARHARPR